MKDDEFQTLLGPLLIKYKDYNVGHVIAYAKIGYQIRNLILDYPDKFKELLPKGLPNWQSLDLVELSNPSIWTLNPTGQ